MDSRLLDRFYKGECSDKEVRQVLHWFGEQQPDLHKEQELNAIWQEAAQRTEEVPGHDAGQVFRKLRAQIGEEHEQMEAGNVVKLSPPANMPLWIKVAAAILLPLCLIGLLKLFSSGAGSAKVVYQTIEAAPGVKKTVYLADGSTVKLNSGSSISFARNFGEESREITLRGEAFFEVAKDSLRPFVVRTGGISTQALGTSFNIDYSSYEGTITVALATGLVKVEQDGQAHKQLLSHLTPGQQLAYDKASGQYAVAPFEKSEVLAWKEGVLTFRKASMDQVIRELENWYGVRIEADTEGEQVDAWNYTGEYHQETLESVLDGIGFVKGFTHTRSGDQVKIMLNQ
ncbi:FecR family protein [Pontibacter chinhatensis]|uniref:FecR family protein n=1 Tax=Pontibacter chinhatensis TaxID=1436961 RepID=A0A1I2VIC6_9BACT|nr:FecR family protein [Pontibacter chinhatensis]SFG87236.1 FecR family protein [Pontibacter chinhatensis]